MTRDQQRVNRSYLFAPGHNVEAAEQGVHRRCGRGDPRPRGRGAGRCRRTALGPWSPPPSRSATALVRVNAAAHRARARPTSTPSPRTPRRSGFPKCESRRGRASGSPAARRAACRWCRRSRRPAACSPRRRSPCVPGRRVHLSIGGLDLLRDLYAGDGGPADALRPHRTSLSCPAGGRAAAAGRQRLPADRRRRRPAGGGASSSARSDSGRSRRSTRGRLPILHEVFAPSPATWQWARQVLAAFEAAGRGATPAAGRGVRRPAGGPARAAAAGDRRPPLAAGPPGGAVAAVVVAMAWLVVAQRARILELLELIARANWWWVGAAVLAQAVSMGAMARQQRRLLGVGGSRFSLSGVLATTYAWNAISVGLPLACLPPPHCSRCAGSSRSAPTPPSPAGRWPSPACSPRSR